MIFQGQISLESFTSCTPLLSRRISRCRIIRPGLRLLRSSRGQSLTRAQDTFSDANNTRPTRVSAILPRIILFNRVPPFCFSVFSHRSRLERFGNRFERGRREACPQARSSSRRQRRTGSSSGQNGERVERVTCRQRSGQSRVSLRSARAPASPSSPAASAAPSSSAAAAASPAASGLSWCRRSPASASASVSRRQFAPRHRPRRHESSLDSEWQCVVDGQHRTADETADLVARRYGEQGRRAAQHERRGAEQFVLGLRWRGWKLGRRRGWKDRQPAREQITSSSSVASGDALGRPVRASSSGLLS